jgi:ABC-type antimicrobial peptide transport system ATPase subunit
MAAVLEMRGLTVDLATQTGWIKPVNDVSTSLLVGETLGVVVTLLSPKCAPLHSFTTPGVS